MASGGKKKVVAFVISCLLIFLAGSAAANNRSYYRCRMQVGERISNISNLLHLGYTGRVFSYRFYTQLDISKEYRFLEGHRRARKLGYDNYLVEINRQGNSLQLGLVDPKSSSSFLYLRNLVGGYLTVGNYRYWLGYDTLQGLGLASQSRFRLGLEYQANRRTMSYQAVQVGQSYNHYFSYQDRWLGDKFQLGWETALGANYSDRVAGGAGNVTVSSQLGKFNYTLSGEYTGPGFIAVSSRQNEGYGSCGISIAGRRKIGSVLVNSNLAYRRNNLNGDQKATTHSWTNYWQLSYYAAPQIEYYLKLDGSLDKTYQTNLDQLTKQAKEITVQVGSELNKWLVNARYTQKESKFSSPFFDQQAVFRVNYQAASHQFYADYKWLKRTDWRRQWEVSYSYGRKLFSTAEYSLSCQLTRREKTAINLNQGLQYNFGPDQNLHLNLNLGKQVNSSGVDKSLLVNYRYQF